MNIGAKKAVEVEMVRQAAAPPGNNDLREDDEVLLLTRFGEEREMKRPA